MINSILPDWLIEKLQEEERRKEGETQQRIYIDPPPPQDEVKREDETEYDPNVDYTV